MPTINTPDFDYLTDARNAKRLLGVGLTSIYKWQRSGALPAIKFGKRCTRYRLSDIEALIAAHATPVSEGVSHE